MDVGDRLELHELPGRYGDAVDDRDWDRLGRIFTDDAVFDLTDLGMPRLVGLAEIKRYMDIDGDHPKTHTMTNVYVDETADGIQLHFRILAMLSGGIVGTASYHDQVVKTDEGWRVRHRVVVARRGPGARQPADAG